jgi:hypothetical protein
MRAMRKKRVAKISDMIFHHDNAHCHREAKTWDTIRKLGFIILGHPVYSPDFASCGFFQ